MFCALIHVWFLYLLLPHGNVYLSRFLDGNCVASLLDNFIGNHLLVIFFYIFREKLNQSIGICIASISGVGGWLSSVPRVAGL